MKKLVLFVAVLFTLGIVMFPLNTLAKAKEAKKGGDKVYATVGDKKITQSDLDSKTSMLPPQFRARYESPEGKKRLVEQLAKFTLLSLEARRLKIDQKEEVAKRVQEIADNIIIQELIKQEVMDKIKVNEADIDKYYKEHKEEFVEPEKVKANLIQFAVNEKDPASVKAEKKKKAEQTLKRLKKGEDFEAVAKEVSDDERTKKSGGNTGFFSKGKRAATYGQVFEDKALALEPGKMSGVFEDKTGFYIIKVAEKKPKKEETLQESKQKIERRLQQDQQKQTYDNYIESLKKRYPIKIHDENFAVETPQVKPAEKPRPEKK